MKKDIDFKEIYFNISDFVDNETFEMILEQFDIDRYKENGRTIQSFILTVTQIETKER